MMIYLLFALGWLILCEAVKLYRHKSTVFPYLALHKNEESIYAGMKNICAKDK